MTRQVQLNVKGVYLQNKPIFFNLHEEPEGKEGHCDGDHKSYADNGYWQLNCLFHFLSKHKKHKRRNKPRPKILQTRQRNEGEEESNVKEPPAGRN